MEKVGEQWHITKGGPGLTFDQMMTGALSRNVSKVIFRAEVLSTYDISPVLNLPGLPFPFDFLLHMWGEPGNEASELQELLDQ